MKISALGPLALCLLAIDTVGASRTCRHRTKTNTTPATVGSTTASSPASTPVSDTYTSVPTPSLSFTVSTSTPSTTSTTPSSTPSSFSTPLSTPSSTGQSSAVSSATSAPTPSSSSTQAPPPSSTPESSSSLSSSLTTPPVPTTFSTLTTFSTSITSSSAAPVPTRISPFQLRASTGEYVVAPAAVNNYMTLKNTGGSGASFSIDDGTNYLRVVGGAYLCVNYAQSYQVGVIYCDSAPPQTANGRRFLVCTQSLEDYSVKCQVPVRTCSPMGCQDGTGVFDQFSIDTTTTGGALYLSKTGTTQSWVVPRPLTAVEPAPTGV